MKKLALLTPFLLLAWGCNTEEPTSSLPPPDSVLAIHMENVIPEDYGGWVFLSDQQGELLGWKMVVNNTVSELEYAAPAGGSPFDLHFITIPQLTGNTQSTSYEVISYTGIDENEVFFKSKTNETHEVARSVYLIFDQSFGEIIYKFASTSRTFGKKSSDVLRLSLLEGDSLILVAILQEGSENWRYGWITPTSDDPMIWITENMLTEQCPVVYLQTIPHQYWSIYQDAMEIDGRRPLQRLRTIITEQEFNELGRYPLFQPLELFSRYAMAGSITTSDPGHGNYEYHFFRVGPPNLNFQPELLDLNILEQEDGGISAQLDMNNDYLQVIWKKRKEESPFGPLFARWIVNSDFSEPFYFPELPPIPHNIIPEELHQAEFKLHQIQTVKDSRIDGYNGFFQRLLLTDTPIWEEDPGLDYSWERTSRYFE